MPVFYELSYVDDDAPVEFGNPMTSGSVSTGTASSALPNDGYVTITATENGYVAFGPNVTAAAADPRRRVLSGVARSFKVLKNDKIGFTAG